MSLLTYQPQEKAFIFYNINTSELKDCILWIWKQKILAATKTIIVYCYRPAGGDGDCDVTVASGNASVGPTLTSLPACGDMRGPGRKWSVSMRRIRSCWSSSSCSVSCTLVDPGDRTWREGRERWACAGPVLADLELQNIFFYFRFPPVKIVYGLSKERTKRRNTLIVFFFNKIIENHIPR